ncbi:arginine:ornithine antiporter, partial [Salmonella enterica subsp. enterica serovar Infantis]
GVQPAASINLGATRAQLVPLGAFIVLAIRMFKLDTFTLDFTGVELGSPGWEQGKNTMLITLGVVIGGEGAGVGSARATK